MFTVSLTIQDLDLDTPEEAVEAFRAALLDVPLHYDVRNHRTGERALIQAEPIAARDALAILSNCLPALTLLGNYIGNEWKGGGGIEPFDRCALIARVRDALAKGAV